MYEARKNDKKCAQCVFLWVAQLLNFVLPVLNVVVIIPVCWRDATESYTLMLADVSHVSSPTQKRQKCWE